MIAISCSVYLRPLFINECVCLSFAYACVNTGEGGLHEADGRDDQEEPAHAHRERSRGVQEGAQEADQQRGAIFLLYCSF